MASFKEAVQSNEKYILWEPPAILADALVLVVGVLEFGADINCCFESGTGVYNISFRSNVLKKLASVDVIIGFVDDSVADLSNEHNQSAGTLVVWVVFPDQ